eukprot:TRINITY_DN16166_c0_g1_i1.p1 TRINITY_DN16166_c0_g1~~TRINITY_DN16166_c0_g1_i1.p1  ORF type:complete len:485 (+),score=134.34 TRINITY_DN16166_c0_g1_i1:54-1457(+)
MGGERRLNTLRSHLPTDRKAKIEFYFDVSSFNAYRGYKKVEGVAEHCGAEVSYKPFLIGGLFKTLVPNVNYTVDTPKGKFTQYGPVPWMLALKNRGSKAHVFSTKMPAGVMKHREGYTEVRRPLTAGAPSIHAMRTCLAADTKDAESVCREVMDLYHVKCKMMVPNDLAPVNSAYGITITDEVKKGLAQATQQAIDDGLVGAPMFMVSHPGSAEKVLFFGVDRLPLVHQYLKGEDSRETIEKIFSMRMAAGATATPNQKVIVYHDIRSPWSYFTIMEMERIRKTHNVEIEYKAVDLAEIQEKQGLNPGVLKASVPNKLKYLKGELQLWAKWFGLPPLSAKQVAASPLDTPPETDAQVVLEFLAKHPQHTNALYQSYWRDDRDLSTEEHIVQALKAQGVSAIGDSLPSTPSLNLVPAIATGITTVPFVDLPASDFALHTDMTNPTGLCLLEDYLCGWSFPADVELAKI